MTKCIEMIYGPNREMVAEGEVEARLIAGWIPRFQSELSALRGEENADNDDADNDDAENDDYDNDDNDDAEEGAEDDEQEDG